MSCRWQNINIYFNNKPVTKQRPLINSQEKASEQQAKGTEEQEQMATKNIFPNLAVVIEMRSIVTMKYFI